MKPRLVYIPKQSGFFVSCSGGQVQATCIARQFKGFAGALCPACYAFWAIVNGEAGPLPYHRQAFGS